MAKGRDEVRLAILLSRRRLSLAEALTYCQAGDDSGAEHCMMEHRKKLRRNRIAIQVKGRATTV
jgi:hypothetical protein